MNSEQAKFVLAAYRPGMGYERDPLMAEAIEQLLRDPELARWFARERAFDELIARKLLEKSPPEDLRVLIWVGLRASCAVSQRRRHALAMIGMAATVVIAGGLAAISWLDTGERPGAVTKPAPLTEWQTACVSIFADPKFRLDLTGRDYASLERHLMENGTRVAGELPFDAQATIPIGCKVLTWRGQPVSLVCFRAETGEVLHLFVRSLGVADEAPLNRGAHRTPIGEFAAITWTRHNLVIMVASKMAAERLASIVYPNAA